MGAWGMLASLWPSLVGGCRPIRISEFVGGPLWEVQHREVVVAYGVASEILVAGAVPRPVG